MNKIQVEHKTLFITVSTSSSYLKTSKELAALIGFLDLRVRYLSILDELYNQNTFIYKTMKKSGKKYNSLIVCNIISLLAGIEF